MVYIYIVGRGFSGSTILDVMLGNTADVESVGELVGSMANPEHVCSCGARLSECPFWTRVRVEVEAAGVDFEALVRASLAQANVRHLAGTAVAKPGARPELDRLAEGTRVLAAAIANVGGKPHLLDAGKEPTRALFLLKFLGEARLVHLVRNPHDVLASYQWRVANGEGVLFLRRRYRSAWASPWLLLLAAASWTVGNLIVEAVARIGPGRVVRVRYEDLRDRPEETLSALGRALGVPLNDVVEKLQAGRPLSVYHNLGGNRARRAGTIRFSRTAGSPRAAPSRWLSAAVDVLCWPLMRRYGYRRPLPDRKQAGSSV